MSSRESFSPPPGVDWRAPFAEGELDLGKDPMTAFERWLADAVGLPVAEPTAMTLATADRRGRPHARTVLFKGLSYDHQGRSGIEFYTNFNSPKSQELLENPFAALVFYWPQLRRQIRFEGAVERLTKDESNAYFQSRGRGSQIGAWSSPQSEKIASRDVLEKLIAENEHRYSGREVPCPEFWGGWRLSPEKIEFWEERPSRLHERRLYEWENGNWNASRLAP